MQLKALPVIITLLGVLPLSNSLVTLAGQKVIGNSNDAFDNVRKALKQADIIDEVIDDFKPKCFLAPFYGKEKTPVALGNVFKQSETKKSPSLSIYCPGCKSTSGLTIVLTDPDAPSRKDPQWSEMCHWIGVIPVSESMQMPKASGLEFELEFTELVEYKPPGPPAKTGYHRYVFLLLEGDNTNLTIPEDRQHWGTGKKRHGVRDWAKSEDLEVVGANFFIEKNTKQ